MMVKNRYFKNTLGIFAELVIASTLDVEETTGTGGGASSTTVPVTIGAAPTIGESISIVVDGVTYLYTVPAGGATTQQAHDAIAALLPIFPTECFISSARSLIIRVYL